MKVVKRGFGLTAMVMAISLTATGCGNGAGARRHQNYTTDMFAAALEQSGEREAEDNNTAGNAGPEGEGKASGNEGSEGEGKASGNEGSAGTDNGSEDVSSEGVGDALNNQENAAAEDKYLDDTNQEETYDWLAEYEANQELYDQEYLDWLMMDDAEMEGYIDDPSVVGHGAKEEEFEDIPDLSSTEGVDVDLTLLSSTLVYAEVYNMMYYPEDYVGKIIKMKGSFNVYTDTEKGIDYLAVLVADAAACCQQGLEFTWEGHKYPEDYPEMGTEMTVTGEVELYEEDGLMYLRIIADSVEF
ncbi:MAG: hypothetical protein K6F97_03950 [Lachnospiraceae bacterium]|nr:hypothetical protein [Lachnospiraceae bacterium]